MQGFYFAFDSERQKLIVIYCERDFGNVAVIKAIGGDVFFFCPFAQGFVLFLKSVLEDFGLIRRFVCAFHILYYTLYAKIDIERFCIFLSFLVISTM